jgi:hypothetical protein
MDWIAKAVVTAVLAVFQALLLDLGRGLMNLLSGLLTTPMDLLQDLSLLELIRFARNIAWIILPVILIRQAFTIVTSRAEGSATESFENFGRRALLAGFAVAGTTTIVTLAMKFADSLIQSFLLAGTGLDVLNVLFSGNANFFLIFLALALVIGFIVLLINRAILVAQLAAQMFLGPLLACSIAWGDSAPFNTWLRETIAIILTFVWQTALLWWMLAKLASWGNIEAKFDEKLLVLGILVLMVKGGETIRKYTYSAGGGSAVLSGAAAATRMAVTYAMFRAAPGAIFRQGGGSSGGGGGGAASRAPASRTPSAPSSSGGTP